MKQFFFSFSLFVFIAINSSLFAQQRQQDETVNSPVNWLDIKTADSLFQRQPKPFLVDVYTDWCGWCKVMMKKTFSNPDIAAYINQHFYPVRINAEKDDSLYYNGKWYVKTGKVNPLAAYLLNNRLAYPTIVYIDLHRRHYPIPGYYDVKKIQPILVYFAEGINNYESLENFINQYYYTYPKYYQDLIDKLPENQKLDTTGTVQWITFEQAQKLNDKKLYFVFAYVEWCNGCKVMQKTTFRNPIIAEIINKNFKPIKFDLATQETITINGNVYKSLGTMQPHQLALSIFNNRLYYPAFVFLDIDFNIISVIPGYFSAKRAEPILQYFAQGKYLTQKYEQFVKNFNSQIK